MPGGVNSASPGRISGMKTPIRPVIRMRKSAWADLVRAANADTEAAHRAARRVKARAFADAKRARLEATEGV